jgi:hypothetical protein
MYLDEGYVSASSSSGPSQRNVPENSTNNNGAYASSTPRRRLRKRYKRYDDHHDAHHDASELLVFKWWRSNVLTVLRL